MTDTAGEAGAAVVRQEEPGDREAVRGLLLAAFGGPYEAGLVARLREDGAAVLSLVAMDSGHLAGHVLFSRLTLEMDGRPVRAAALAPVAVRPEFQRRGLGGRLIRAGIERLCAMDLEAVIVLGHPEYYRRFGFSAERAAGIVSPYSGPAFMALELVPGALAGRTGSAVYPAAFDTFP